MQKEQLSAYIDGEQISEAMTEKLCQNADLQKSWANFHTIRAVMRQESEVLLGADFTAKMADLIEQEEIVVAQPMVSQPMPEETAQSPFMQKLKAWFMPMTQFAVAAGVCLVAVMGVQSFMAHNGKENQDAPVLQTLPFNNSVQEVSYNAPTQSVITPEQIEQKNKRIDSMLQSYELQKRIYADRLNLQNQK
ncbi:sigma-E factor negative regulatory protein [Avibacterium avium]|uniref:Anti-sigma-E factor RseA n=1 Tax=Avibacterium gallinarum TaxID=755 RepID=A0A379B116_AVIGA|nr:sigma-E factor negative regulatory protein [Avibacterium gallinarum]POY44190.1 transcriptional regulator [Avibacterium gallinarum]TDP29282.1 sigma-E factor negative regulatory protein RseA [Avibacterium gallinarum]SUB28172.1 sigma-E factor negative regulatory protein [Avibacterium gallinarum]